MANRIDDTTQRVLNALGEPKMALEMREHESFGVPVQVWVCQRCLAQNPQRYFYCFSCGKEPR
jgi:ribosomal protein L40E